MTRVVVTGVGPVTPIGIGARAYLDGLRSGRSGTGPITRFDTMGFRSRIGGEIHDFEPDDWIDEEAQQRTDRSLWLALAAARLALEDAGLEADEAAARGGGVVLGNATGGAEFADRELVRATREGLGAISRHLYQGNAPGALLRELCRRLGLAGPALLISTGCTAGTDAIGEAARKIRNGDASLLLAGGCDAPLAPTLHASFDVIGAVSCRNHDPAGASRPFDAERDGFVMAEGAGMVVLESLAYARARGAPRIYGEVGGFAATSNAYHMTAPAPDPVENARAVETALRRAGVAREDVDYVSAHGSSTRLNDVAETRLMKRVFGGRAPAVPLSSTKSQVGHPLGAAGAFEAIACLFALRHGFLPPTINHGEPGPECDLDYVPNQARPACVDVAVSNACAFGGLNSVLVLTGSHAR